LFALAFAFGCVAPARPPAAFAVAPISAEQRAMQTRVFATDDEAAVLAACGAVLQRHGFAAEDHDSALGVIVASKDAESAGGRSRLRISVATQLAGEFSLDVRLRVTLQRLAWNARGRETLREAVREPSEYAGFLEEVARELALPTASIE
jgi:hypothetical protein